ncbi:MAG: glycosyltransferase family 39 protein [Myxococcota bacterium]
MTWLERLHDRTIAGRRAAVTVSARRIFLAWAVLTVLLGLGALPGLERLGLYYDEAFMAQQARGFLEPDRAGTHPASVRSVDIGGRPFPLRNAVYLGSLKSQLLIPALAAGGSSVRVVRTATLACALTALLLAMLWASRLFGETASIWMGIFVASDPSFFFFSQFEWGPFTTNFLCRAAGALLVVVAWQSPSRRRSALAAGGAGLWLGLGVFSRADFGIILACAGLALLLARPDLVTRAWHEKRGAVLAGSAAFLLAALPMILSSLDLLTTGQAVADRGDLSFRLGVLTGVLDGSHFQRLMRAGGVFEHVQNTEGSRSFLSLMLIPAAALLIGDLWHQRRKGSPIRQDAWVFLLLTTGFVIVAMLALPGAVRAHHQLNALPLPHLILGCAVVSLWRMPRPRGLGPVIASLAVVLLLAGNLRVIAATQSEITSTGGRGRFSSEISALAEEIDAQPQTQVVSLDWGFHEPLLFLTDRAQMVEPIWVIPQFLARRQPWTFAGDEDTTYLVHGPEYDLFGIGPALLLAARTNADPSIEVTPHRDGSGDVAFYSVQIHRPHELSFNGRFRIRPR